jgi:hypothetical protein
MTKKLEEKRTGIVTPGSGFALKDTPLYEIVENTASLQTVGNNRPGHGLHDGVRCIWRCPRCKFAMTIGPCGRIALGQILTVSLTCENRNCPGKLPEEKQTQMLGPLK